jgi:tetratricopeptide (TPR) repeat protein
MNMGVLYLKNRLLAQASTQFERVLKVAPNHQDARLHLAIIDATRGKNKEAIETYKSILTQDATNQLVLFNLAAAQKNVGQFDEAVENLKKFIKISPETSENTNQAFAMIDDINNLKLAKGEKVSDEDLVALAQELATRKSMQKNQSVGGQSTSANGSNNKKSSTSTTAITKQAKSEAPVEPSANDLEIEALEKQLNSPAH